MATIKKGLKKAKNGTTTTKTTKKPVSVDKNTTEQKSIFDNRYNEIYNQTKNDSITESNKTIGKTYLALKQLKGKTPSAAQLLAEQIKKNKEKVNGNTPGSKITKLNAKQRADDRFEQEMSGNDDRVREDLLMDRNGGRHKKKMKNGGAMLRQAPKSTMEKISSTKLKDVPEKAVNFGKKVINKGKKLASDTVEKVKNTTVGDAAKTVGNAVKTAASATPAGIIYKAAKNAANSEIGQKIKEDLKPENMKKAFKNIGAAFGLKHGGKVSKMRNGGSLSGLKASNKRVGPIDPKGAFTKVQKKTLRGAKGKASLTKDKQLGATKMTAKFGAKMKKGKSC